VIRLLLIMLLLAGCTAAPVIERAPALAVPIACDSSCTTPCGPASWPRWAGDPDDGRTWDRIGDDVVAPLRSLVDTCEAARASCVRCLRRLERAGIICGATPDGPCP
jgi:hypothetical protein